MFVSLLQTLDIQQTFNKSCCEVTDELFLTKQEKI